MLLSTELCYHPCYRSHSYVIIHRAMLSSKGLCYRPGGYVIIQGAMLLSRGLCYRPQSYVIIHMLSSTELCYCPCYPCYHPYVIVHRAMLLSILSSICYRTQSYSMLLSTELCYCHSWVHLR